MDKGYKIKKLREKNFFSQKEIALKLGITQSAYCKMEACEEKISIENCKLIAKAIGVNLADVLNFDDKYNFIEKEKIDNYNVIIQERDNLLKEIKDLINDNRILLKLLEKTNK